MVYIVYRQHIYKCCCSTFAKGVMRMDDAESDRIGDMLDDDEIASWEEGFMRGYDGESEE